MLLPYKKPTERDTSGPAGYMRMPAKVESAPAFDQQCPECYPDEAVAVEVKYEI